MSGVDAGQEDLSRIAAGSSVLIHGFNRAALRGILQLTQGRGGQFIKQGGLPRYQASGEEPATIRVLSRSGRPLLACAAPRFAGVPHRFWQPYREQLAEWRQAGQQVRLCRDLWPLLAEATAGLLTFQQQPVCPSQVEDWFRGWSRYRMTRLATTQALLQSYAVATGRRPVDIPAAVGETWRQLLPSLIPVLQPRSLRPGDEPAYRRLCQEMERIALGPAAETVGQLLALIRCRRVITCCQGEESQEVWIRGCTHHLYLDSPRLQLLAGDPRLGDQPAGDQPAGDRRAGNQGSSNQSLGGDWVAATNVPVRFGSAVPLGQLPPRALDGFSVRERKESNHANGTKASADAAALAALHRMRPKQSRRLAENNPPPLPERQRVAGLPVE